MSLQPRSSHLKKQIVSVLTLLLALVALSLSSCTTPSTVQSRIAERPNEYSALSSAHRTLVDQGRIKEGMTKEGVYLAWGRADGVREGSSGGKHRETWLYHSYRPVYSDYVGVGYVTPGYAYGGTPGLRRLRGDYYDCYPYGGLSNFGYGTDVHYVPYVSGTVTFSGNRVSSWEQLR